MVGSILSVLGMSLLVLGVLAWQEGGESVAALLLAGVLFSVALVRWLIRRRREGKPTCSTDLFSEPLFRFGILGSVWQQVALGGLLIALPMYLQIDLGLQRAAGRTVARAAVPDDVLHRAAGGQEGGAEAAERTDPRGVPPARRRRPPDGPDRPPRGHEPRTS